MKKLISIAFVSLISIGCQGTDSGDAASQSSSDSAGGTVAGQNTDANVPSGLINGCNPSAAPFGGGDGSAQHPWLICTRDQMAEPLMGNNAKLVADLDYSGVTNYQPIMFHGTLDGGRHTIKNFSYDGRTTNANSGFFSTVSTSTISNLIFDHPTVHGRSGYPAAIVAAEIDDSDLFGIVITAGYLGATAGAETGGIVGRNDYGTVTNSFAAFTYTPGAVGGIVGVNYGTVDLCDSSITTSHGTGDGRVVGYNEAGATVSNCSYGGTTQSTGPSDGYNYGTLTNCN